MDEETLLRRVAEIDGLDLLGPGKMDGRFFARRSGTDEPFEEWNPLDLKEQAFELIEKYGMHVSCDEEGAWDVSVPRRHGSYPGATDHSLAKAILRALVASGYREKE